MLLAVVSIFTDLAVLIAITIVLAITDPVVTVVTVLVFGVFVVGLQRLLRRTQTRLGEESAELSLEAWQYLLPSLDGFREARLSSRGEDFVRGYRSARLRGARLGRDMGIIGDIPRYSLEIGFVLAVAAISAYLFRVGTPAEALVVLGVFAAAALRALPTLTRVSSNIAILRTGQAGLRIFLAAAEQLRSGGAARRATPRSSPIPRGPRHRRSRIPISRRGRAGARRPVDANPAEPHDRVRGVERGRKKHPHRSRTRTAGAYRGSIRCGGRPIADDLAAWYAGLGVVPQDVFLFNDTIATNVAFEVEPDRVDLAPRARGPRDGAA